MDLNDKHKDLFIPQWFEKEHFEKFLDIELTDKQFQEIKELLIEESGGSIADIISEDIREELSYLKKEHPELFKK